MTAFDGSPDENDKGSPYRKRLEQLKGQLVQNGRWISVGRVVAAISHSIMNRMQAVQGALTLALEEPALSTDMHTYLEMSLQEARRVIAQVNRLRRVYHPEADTLELVNVPELLAEVAALASDAADSGAVAVETVTAADLPLLRCRAGQLQFILLGTVLNLIDLVDSRQPAQIRIEARQAASKMEFRISTNTPHSSWARALEAGPMQEAALGVPAFREVAAAQGGTLEFSWSDSAVKIHIRLPISTIVL